MRRRTPFSGIPDVEPDQQMPPRHLRLMSAPSVVAAAASLGGPSALHTAIAERTIAGSLYERLPEQTLRCNACAHRCVLPEGRTGVCGVRFHRSGELRVPFGYVARRYVRPVETNTIFHVRPGAKALTFGMFGCDLRCPYCHNWHLSQALRETVTTEMPMDCTAAQLVQEAQEAGCSVLCSAYNEPMITAEWAYAVFQEAKRCGLVTALISDGNTTPEALAYMRPVTDVFRVDLKGYTAEQYQSLGGRLEPVLAALSEARRLGYWVEIVTLIVPAFNDDLGGLRRLAIKLAGLDPLIPWHLNAFYPRYKMLDRGRMDGNFLASAAGMAYSRGIKFVYVNNVPDELSELSHTRCPQCHTLVVHRENYETREVRLLPNGACPSCSTVLPGLW